MARQFFAAKPLQASKLAAVLGTLVFAIVGFFRIVPDQQLAALLLVTFLGPALAIVVAAETLLAGYRAARADGPATARLNARPAYTVVRAGEAIIAVLAAGAFAAVIGTLPDEPIPAPAGVGLLLLGFGLGLLVLVASLVRTLAEYYFHRHSAA